MDDQMNLVSDKCKRSKQAMEDMDVSNLTTTNQMDWQKNIYSL